MGDSYFSGSDSISIVVTLFDAICALKAVLAIRCGERRLMLDLKSDELEFLLLFRYSDYG